MSLPFRFATQREPDTQPQTRQRSNMQPQTQPRDASSNNRAESTNTTMATSAQERPMRGNPRDSGIPSYNDRGPPHEDHRQLRPQRRSFDNMSSVSNSSNTPSVGTGSDIGGRGAPPPAINSSHTTQPPAVRRPSFIYPGPRLASSRQTYSIRRRSQSQGMSTDDFRESLRRSASRNPDSDSEYSSSELSTTTQATTVASDDESLSGYQEKSPRVYGRTQQRSGGQTPRQHSREPRVQYLSPRSSGGLDPEAPPFDPRHAGSSSTQSSMKSTVQFSEPLKSIRYMPGAWDDHVVDQSASLPPPRPSRVAPSVPTVARSDRRADDKSKSASQPQLDTHKATTPRSTVKPVDQAVTRRSRADDVLLDKIEQLKEETQNLHQKQNNSSKVLEDTLVRLSTLQVDKEAAERISNQEKELREGLAQELDEQERVIEKLEQTVNETVRQLQKTTLQLADAQKRVQEGDGLALDLAELRSQFTEASKILVDVQKERGELRKTLDEAQYQNGKLQRELQQALDEKKGQESYFVTRLSTLETEKETLGIRVETMETTQKTHEMQFSDLLRENVSLKMDADKLGENIKTLIAEKAAGEEANRGLKGCVEYLEKDKVGLCFQVEGLQKDKESLQLQAEKLNAEEMALELRIVALEEDKAGLNTHLEVVEGERRQLQDQMSGLEGENGSLKSRIDNLENDKKELETRLEGLMAKLKSLNTNIQGVSGERHDLKSRLHAMEAERRDMDRDLDGMEGEIHELKKRVDSLTSEKEELTALVKTATGDKIKLEDQIQQLEAQVDETNGKHHALDMAYAAQVTLSGALAAERDSLKAEIEAINAKPTDQHAETEELKQADNTTELDLDIPKTSNLETENQQLKDAPPDVTALLQTVTEKDAQIITLQEETAAKVSSIQEESSAQIATLQEETSAKITTLTTEKTELEAKVTGLETRISELTPAADQVPGLLEQNNSLTTQLTVANAQIADLVLQLAAAAEQVNQYRTTTEKSNNELAKAQRTVGHLKTRLENRAVPKKKTSVRVKQEDLVLVRSADKTTLQVVKKTDIRPSRSSSATRSNSDSS